MGAVDLPTDWRTDPIVRIENALLPLLSGLPTLICLRACDARDTAREEELHTGLLAFARHLESGFSSALEGPGFELGSSERAICDACAAVIRKLAAAFHDDATDPRELLAQFDTQMRPAALDALDAVRSVFISGVLTRQADHARRAEHSMKELGQLSRAIQFVAINASIEAARNGEAGKAFALIAAEIRGLAGSARTVIDKSAA